MRKISKCHIDNSILHWYHVAYNVTKVRYLPATCLTIGVLGALIGKMSPPAPTNLLYASSKYVLSLKSGTKKNAPKHKRRKAININNKTYFSLSLSPDLWTGIGWKFLLWWVGKIAIFEELYAAITSNAADTVYPRRLVFMIGLTRVYWKKCLSSAGSVSPKNR